MDHQKEIQISMIEVKGAIMGHETGGKYYLGKKLGKKKVMIK